MGVHQGKEEVDIGQLAKLNHSLLCLPPSRSQHALPQVLLTQGLEQLLLVIHFQSPSAQCSHLVPIKLIVTCRSNSLLYVFLVDRGVVFC
jgi:hypothetical protein